MNIFFVDLGRSETWEGKYWFRRQPSELSIPGFVSRDETDIIGYQYII